MTTFHPDFHSTINLKHSKNNGLLLTIHEKYVIVVPHSYQLFSPNNAQIAMPSFGPALQATTKELKLKL